jgi:hypothetical protein
MSWRKAIIIATGIVNVPAALLYASVVAGDDSLSAQLQQVAGIFAASVIFVFMVAAMLVDLSE